MRKCFTLALLLLAVAVLTVSPAGATAPLISDLPRIVMATDDPGDEILLNALNLDVYINWHPGGANADYSESDFVVYLYDPSTERELLLSALTTETLDALVNSPYQTPAGVVNAYAQSTTTSNWLSLTYLDHSANVTGNVTLVAGVVDGNGITTSSQGIMEVVTNDAGGKDLVPFARYQSPDHEIDSLLDGWYNQVVEIAGQYNTIPLVSGKVGYDTGTAGSPNGNLGSNAFSYGHMLSGDGTYNPATGTFAPGDIGTFMIPQNGVSHDGGPGLTAPVYKVTAEVSGTAPNPEDMAGWRFGFLNAANTHHGYVTALTGTEKDATAGYTTSIITPSANLGNINLEIWIVVPVGTSGMTDTQIGAYTAGGTAADGRDYGLLFDVLDFSGDFGEFVLENVAIAAYELADYDTADSGAASKTYAPGTDFPLYGNDLIGSGFADGAAVASGGVLTLSCPAAQSLSFYKANPLPQAANLYSVAPGALVRTRIVAKSQNVETVPTLRLYEAFQIFDAAGTALLRDRGLAIEEHWGAVGLTYKAPGNKPAGAVNPGVALATDTTLTCLWRMPAVGAADSVVPTADDTIITQLQVYKFGAFGGGAGDWSDPTGGLDISSVTIDTVAE